MRATFPWMPHRNTLPDITSSRVQHPCVPSWRSDRSPAIGFLTCRPRPEERRLLLDKRKKKIERKVYEKVNDFDIDSSDGDDSSVDPIAEVNHENIYHNSELTDEKRRTRHKFSLPLFDVTSRVNKTAFADIKIKRKGEITTVTREIIFEMRLMLMNLKRRWIGKSAFSSNGIRPTCRASR